jgi:hypothetical protein
MPDEFSDVYLNRGEEITANRKKRKEEVRGSILPFRKDDDGLHWALPKFITDVVDAINLPSDTLKGYQPTAEDTTNFALNTMGGGLGASAIAKPEADVGMFLGTRARGANIRKAEQAADMASRGIDKDRIWNDTGWFQDRDGNWKWELSDDQMDLTPDANERLDAHNRFTGKASDAIEHPDLFNQYPEGGYADPLKPDAELQVLDPQMSYDHMGTYSQKRSTTGREDILAKGKTKDHLLDVTAHELQHAVQRREGFEPGGNIRAHAGVRQDILDYLPNEAKNFLALKEIVQKRARQLSVAEQTEKSDAPSGWTHVGGEDDLSVDELKQELQHYLPQFTETQDKIAPYMNDLAPIFDYLAKDDWTNYARGSGEVEARNTATRRTMTPEERRNNAPWNTQDFSDDQISTHTENENLIREARDFRIKWENNLSQAEQDALIAKREGYDFGDDDGPK